MEVLAAASVRNQVPYPVLEEILQCVTTEEAVRKLDACGKKDAVMQELLSKIMFYLNKRAAGKNADRGLSFTPMNLESWQSPLEQRSFTGIDVIYKKGNKTMVYFVGAGPGAADLITVRGMRLLEQADVVIYAGSLVNPELLSYCKRV